MENSSLSVLQMIEGLLGQVKGSWDVGKGPCVGIIRVHNDISVLVSWGHTGMVSVPFTVLAFIGFTAPRVGPKSSQAQCSSGSEGSGISRALVRKKIYLLP